ncbi:hypothetical protein ACHAQK_002819 [Fusarium lateritium]
MSASAKDVASFAHNELNQIDKSAQLFHIEMIDRRLVDRIFCTPVRDRPDLFESWEQLNGSIPLPPSTWHARLSH